MDKDDYKKGFYNAYQRASDTVSQVGQVVMLYDGAINFIKQAKEAILEKNYDKAVLETYININILQMINTTINGYSATDGNYTISLKSIMKGLFSELDSISDRNRSF